MAAPTAANAHLGLLSGPKHPCHTPWASWSVMEPADTLRFATAARALARVARSRGLVAPGFRSPPRVSGADRTLRRRVGGAPTVAVRVRGRAWAPVLSDMVEGVVAANGLHGVEADRLRAELWEAAIGAESPTVTTPPARVA